MENNTSQEVTWTDPEDDSTDSSVDISFTEYDIGQEKMQIHSLLYLGMTLKKVLKLR